jgi:hypothetical protein
MPGFLLIPFYVIELIIYTISTKAFKSSDLKAFCFKKLPELPHK